MIVRAPSRPHPIPFEDPLQGTRTDLQVPRPPARTASSGKPADSAAGWPPAETAPPAGHKVTEANPPPFTDRNRRKVLARHDGTSGLSVRSANTGRHYRFEPNGGLLWVDAADAALLKRNPNITLL